MQNNQAIIASALNEGLKNFIIGKLWIHSTDGSRPGAIRINRNLATDIILKAGTTLFLNHNKKRDNKQDADYSISVLLPATTANQLIEAERQTKLATVD